MSVEPGSKKWFEGLLGICSVHSTGKCADRLFFIAAELTKLADRYRWRPIAELHEDYGSCVLMNIDDPGYMEIGSNLNTDYDESQWTHFSQIVPLTTEEAERMKKEMGNDNRSTTETASDCH